MKIKVTTETTEKQTFVYDGDKSGVESSESNTKYLAKILCDSFEQREKIIYFLKEEGFEHDTHFSYGSETNKEGSFIYVDIIDEDFELIRHKLLSEIK